MFGVLSQSQRLSYASYKVVTTNLVQWAMQCIPIRNRQWFWLSCIVTLDWLPWNTTPPPLPKDTTQYEKVASMRPMYVVQDFFVMFVKFLLFTPFTTCSNYSNIGMHIQSCMITYGWKTNSSCQQMWPHLLKWPHIEPLTPPRSSFQAPIVAKNLQSPNQRSKNNAFWAFLSLKYP